MTPTDVIELVGAALGILYVILEMRASMWLWPVGVVMPFFYIYLSWESAVYGNVLVNVYYILACLVGWWMWHKRRGEAPDTPQISWASRPARVLTVGGTIVLVPLLAYAFDAFMESPFPLWDAVATSVSLIGMVLLAKEYVETWYCWLIANVIYCALYFYQGYTVTGVFYAFYTGVALWGLLRWIRLARV